MQSAIPVCWQKWGAQPPLAHLLRASALTRLEPHQYVHDHLNQRQKWDLGCSGSNDATTAWKRKKERIYLTLFNNKPKNLFK